MYDCRWLSGSSVLSLLSAASPAPAGPRHPLYPPLTSSALLSGPPLPPPPPPPNSHPTTKNNDPLQCCSPRISCHCASGSPDKETREEGACGTYGSFQTWKSSHSHSSISRPGNIKRPLLRSEAMLPKGCDLHHCLASFAQVEGWHTVKQLCQQIRSKLGERLKIARRRSHYRPHHLRHRTSISTRHHRSHQQGGRGAVGSHQSQVHSVSKPSSGALPDSQESSGSLLRSSGSLGPSVLDEYRTTLSLSQSSSASASSQSTAIRDPGSFEAQAEAGAAADAHRQAAEPSQSQPFLMARTVSGVMRSSLEVVSADMSIQEAFKLMMGKKGSCLVVDNGELEEPGIVTKRDFLTKQAAEHIQLTVGDVQTRPIAFVRSSDLLTMASELMSKLRVRMPA